MITDNLQLVETARLNLRFEVAEAAVDATALMEYLEKYSRPAPDLAAVPGHPGRSRQLPGLPSGRIPRSGHQPGAGICTLGSLSGRM